MKYSLDQIVEYIFYIKGMNLEKIKKLNPSLIEEYKHEILKFFNSSECH